MKLVEHLTESIEHYNRMIEWVKTQSESGRPSILDMFYEIKEQWSGVYCSLCKNYYDREFDDCSKCILYQKGYYCNEPGFIWKRMNYSLTWEDWLFYANKMRQLLIDIREELLNEP